jgi:hypothetical protein
MIELAATPSTSSKGRRDTYARHLCAQSSVSHGGAELHARQVATAMAATQSGVAAMAFGLIATRVGGLPDTGRDEYNGC